MRVSRYHYYYGLSGVSSQECLREWQSREFLNEEHYTVIPVSTSDADIPHPKTVRTKGASAPLLLFLTPLDPVCRSILIFVDLVVDSREELVERGASLKFRPGFSAIRRGLGRSSADSSSTSSELCSMADPFEVRMRFTSQLQHLNASVNSSQKAAHYALKHRDMDEDLHSCILEQIERVCMSDVPLCFSGLNFTVFRIP